MTAEKPPAKGREYLGSRLEAGRFAAAAADAWTLVGFAGHFTTETAFGRPPGFIADIQTTTGADPANLRRHDLSEVGLSIGIAEERSLDAENSHTDGAVGYFVFGDSD